MIYPHSQIWTPETIRDIHARAQGEYMLSGFRPFRDLPGFDELVFLAAGLTRFPLEGYKEKCKTETILGTRWATKPLNLETPIYVSTSSELPRGVRVALARGSRLVGSAVSVVGGGVLPEERKEAGRLVHQFQVGIDDKSVVETKADAIQLNLVRQTSVEKLASLIKRARSSQDQRIPVFVGLPAGSVRDEVKAVVKAGADGIVLEGLATNPAYVAEKLTSHSRLPILAALPLAREALKESKVLGEVNLIAGNGVRNGADAAKALALGADAVVIHESALIALGYYTVHTDSMGEQKVVMTTSQARKFESQGERVAKFINSMTMEIALLARSLGKGDVHSLEYEDLAALSVEAALMTGVRLAGE